MIAWHHHVLYTRDWSFFSFFWPRIETHQPRKRLGVLWCVLVYFVS